MRRIVITGLIVFSALTLSWVGGASGQRVREAPAAMMRTPTQVEVTNFPPVQGVSGTVNVGNFPAAAPITVNVITPTIHFGGFTRFPVATINGSTPNILDLNRICHADFPGTRTCIKEEIALSIPPPPSWPDRAWTLEHGTETSNPLSLRAGCLSAIESDTSPCGGGPYPVACCGF